MQSRRLAASFEGLNSSLAQSPGEVMELQTGKKIAARCRISKYDICVHWHWSC